MFLYVCFCSDIPQTWVPHRRVYCFKKGFEMEKAQKQVLPGAIDVHAYYVNRTYRSVCEAVGKISPVDMPELPSWSPAQALTVIDRAGAEVAMLLLSLLGVHRQPAGLIIQVL